MDEMSLIHPATTTKTDAKTALDQKAQQQDTIINGNNDATDEEKAKARELVEQAKTEAKNNINSDHTTIDVNNEKLRAYKKLQKFTQLQLLSLTLNKNYKIKLMIRSLKLLTRLMQLKKRNKMLSQKLILHWLRLIKTSIKRILLRKLNVPKVMELTLLMIFMQK